MPGRFTLAIETSNPSAWTPDAPRPGVVVGLAPQNGDAQLVRILARADTDPAAAHRDDLMLAIDAAVRDAGLAPSRLHRVAVSVGPGGFTAVRIAITAARMIAEVTGAECVPVPSAFVAARRAPAHAPCVALASKADSAYLAWFDAAGRTARPACIVTARSFDPHGCSCLLADRFLPAALRDRAAAIGLPIAPLVLDPAACLEASLSLPAVDPAAAAPIYPREPEAVTKWRALHPPR